MEEIKSVGLENRRLNKQISRNLKHLRPVLIIDLPTQYWNWLFFKMMLLKTGQFLDASVKLNQVCS